MSSAYRCQDLPSTTELPYSDGRPVDNELHNLLPNLLRFSLLDLWGKRMDWYFGVKMAIYHTTGIDVRVPAVPEAFLCVGVDRRREPEDRGSYATWENDDVRPVLVLEMVSHIPRGEYDEGMSLYAELGVLYYVVYNQSFWQRDGHQPFEVYRLEEGHYQLQQGEPYWMPEVGLGIGRYQGQFGNVQMEMMAWYNEQGVRHFSGEEQARLRADQARSRADQEQLRADQAESLLQEERLRRERLEEVLRAQGIDPEDLS